MGQKISLLCTSTARLNSANFLRLEYLTFATFIEFSLTGTEQSAIIIIYSLKIHGSAACQIFSEFLSIAGRVPKKLLCS